MNRHFQLALIESGVGTITQLSRCTGIERTKLNRIVNGVSAATPSERSGIARSLDRPVAALFHLGDGGCTEREPVRHRRATPRGRRASSTPAQPLGRR